LIEATSGTHLWADKFDGALEEIFELQDKITEQVVGAIVPRLAAADIEASRQRNPTAWSSYDHYLRGLGVLARRNSVDGARAALPEFRAATNLSPGFGQAWAFAAHCIYILRNVLGAKVSEEERAEALRDVARALELASDDESVLALAAFSIANLNNEFERAAALADKAIALNPNHANGWNARGWMYLCLGDVAIASDAFGRALRLNPLDPVLVPNLQIGNACACMFAGDYSQGLTWAQLTLAERPTDLLGLIAFTGNSIFSGQTNGLDDLAFRLKNAYPNLRRSTLRGFYPARRAEHQALLDSIYNRLGLPE
jgi:tetratricopeptide (TPR) repeat protein